MNYQAPKDKQSQWAVVFVEFKHILLTNYFLDRCITKSAIIFGSKTSLFFSVCSSLISEFEIGFVFSAITFFLLSNY